LTEPPSSLGSYRVLHQLGVGAVGPVFLASDEVVGGRAAIKIFHLDLIPEHASRLVQRLNDLAARLPSHPVLIKLLEAGLADTNVYLAAELVDAPALDARLRQRDPQLPAELLARVETLAEAVDAVHAAGLDHGALHPRDVFLSADGVRAGGFGITRALEEMALRAPVRLPYTAPERSTDSAWGPPADVFSLASIVFEALSGVRPGGTGRAAAERLPPTGDPDRDRTIRDVFGRALSADPSQRPASALAFVRALRDAGVAEVFGIDAPTRVAVRHRAGRVSKPATVTSRPPHEETAPEPASQIEAPEADLTRFAREGVLPAASPRSARASRPRKPASRAEADSLLLFGTEDDKQIPAREDSLPDDVAAASYELDEAAPDVDTDVAPFVDDVVAEEEEAAPSREEGESWLVSSADIPVVEAVGDALEPPVADDLDVPPPVTPLPPREVSDWEDARPTPDSPRGPQELDEDLGSSAPPVKRFELEPYEDAHKPPESIWARPSTGGWSDEAPGWTRAPSILGEPEEADERPRRRGRVAALLLLPLLAVVGWFLLRGADRVPSERRPQPSDAEMAQDASEAVVEDEPRPDSTREPAVRREPPAARTPAPVRPRATPPQTPPPVVARRETTPVPAAEKPAVPAPSPAPAPGTRDTATRRPAPAPVPPSPPAADAPRAEAGRLLVRTSPSASVEVDGVRRGSSPIAVYDLDWGAHTVVVSRGGYASETRRIVVSPDRPAATLSLDLRARGTTVAAQSAAGATAAGTMAPAGAGQLQFASRPTGARVYLDGRPVGTTPALVSNVPGGVRTVRFEMTGYRAWQTRVEVVPGQRVRVAASLEQTP
jgi:serine/threonine protein kinase